jgi:hypothetical protein
MLSCIILRLASYRNFPAKINRENSKNEATPSAARLPYLCFSLFLPALCSPLFAPSAAAALFVARLPLRPLSRLIPFIPLFSH